MEVGSTLETGIHTAQISLSEEKPNLGKMFAVHLMAFYFAKLKEDQIKKVRKDSGS